MLFAENSTKLAHIPRQKINALSLPSQYGG